MKVRVFEAGGAEQLQSQVAQWLATVPDITITAVAQSTGSGQMHTGAPFMTTLALTIFYTEPGEPKKLTAY